MLHPAREEVSRGLAKVLADTPVRRGYLEAQAGWSDFSGAYGRLEGGARLAPDFAVFGFGQVDRLGPNVGIGARWEFELF